MGSQGGERRRKRGGAPGGLLIGIATVVAVGVAGKLIQKFNRSKKAAAKDSADQEATASTEGQRPSAAVLTKVLSIVGDRHIESTQDQCDSSAPSKSIEVLDAEQKYTGGETPITVDDGKGTSRPSTADIDHEIPRQLQNSHLSQDSDSKGAEIQVKQSLVDKVVPAVAACDGDRETDLVELVHQHEAPPDGNTMNKTKELRGDIAAAISRALVDFGREKLSTREQTTPQKLTVQVVWNDKTDPEGEADASTDVADSEPGSETPVLHSQAEDNSEGFTYHSESESEPGNPVAEFVDAHDTHTAAADDELEQEFVYAKTQMEDSRTESGESGSESTSWPEAISFKEFIDSVQASTSAEIEDQATENGFASAGSAEERNSFARTQSVEDLLQGDRDYFACEGASAIHEDTENETECSLGESDTYEESHEEAESVLMECEACPSSESREEAELTSRENQMEDASADWGQEKRESKCQGLSNKMEPAVEEKFEESLSSLEAEMTTTNSTEAKGSDAECEVERATVRTGEEEKDTSTIDDQFLSHASQSSTGFSAAHTVVSEEAGGAPNVKGEEDSTLKVKSSMVFPAKPCNPNNSFKHTRRHNMTDNTTTKIARSAITTTTEFTSSSNGGGNLKQMDTSRERSATDVLRMAILIALIAAIIFMIREHHLKPLTHAA